MIDSFCYPGCIYYIVDASTLSEPKLGTLQWKVTVSVAKARPIKIPITRRLRVLCELNDSALRCTACTPNVGVQAIGWKAGGDEENGALLLAWAGKVGRRESPHSSYVYLRTGPWGDS